MSTVTKGNRTYVANGAITDNLLLVRDVDADTVSICDGSVPAGGFAGISDTPRGVASGEGVAVTPLTEENTVEGVASGAIAFGNAVYVAADGKLSTNEVEGGLVGYAEQDAVDGEIFEFRPAVNSTLPLNEYTVATVPAAAANEGRLIYVSDGATGNPCLAYSNGADWLQIALGAAITAA